MPVHQSPRTGHLRRRPARLAALALAAFATLVVGCSEAEPDPAEVRTEVVRNRLEETFSDAQVDCIMGRLDDVVLQAIDRDADLDPDGDAMTVYTEAVTSCVADPASPPPEPDPTDRAEPESEDEGDGAPSGDGGSDGDTTDDDSDSDD